MVDGFDNESLDFLTTVDRQTVQRNIKEIRESSNSLYIGKRVGELQTILAPYGYFTRAIAALKMVQRTAYGYMYGYRNVIERLPPGAVQAMIDRKLTVNANGGTGRIFGEWTEAIAKVPPPMSGSSTTYERWVDEMVLNRPKRLTGHKANRTRKNPEELMSECLHVIERAFRRLPAQGTARERYARDLIRNTMRIFNLEPDKFTPAESLPERRSA